MLARFVLLSFLVVSYVWILNTPRTIDTEAPRPQSVQEMDALINMGYACGVVSHEYVCQ